MEKKEFLRTIQNFRRKINRAQFWKFLVFALCIGGGVGLLFQIISFIVPFYYANVYTLAAVSIAILTALVLAAMKKKSMEQAALTMDSFGFKERIVTAYEHLEEDGPMVKLQREDALSLLKKYKDRIKIPMMPPVKNLLVMAGILMLLCCLMIIPSPVKEKAGALQQVKKEAKEKEKEIEEVIEELENLPAEEMSPEELAALQDMIESMQSTMSEYQQAMTSEELEAANEKLNYKYNNMSNQLNSMAQSMQSGAQAQTMSAQAMQNMSNKLQNMSGNQNLASNQGNQGQNQSGNQNQSGGQNGQNQSGQQGGQNQSGNQQGNSQNGQNNQSGGQNNQNGSQNQSGNQTGQQSGNQNGQSGQGKQSGQGGQNGQSGQNGQGSGSGAGDGSGSGNGGGDGSGGGRGTGSSSTDRDYVSIPNDITDSGNLTGNAQNHEDSDYFKAQSGMSWEGTHVSHEAVLGTYEKNAYEGIAAGNYPSGMEEVIKEYFASFN